MDNDFRELTTRALKAVSDNVERCVAGIQLSIYLHLDTLLLLMERKLLTADEAQKRIQRVLDAAQSQPELAPATSLLAGLIAVLRRLAEAAAQSNAEQALEQADKVLREFLEKMATGTMH